LQFEDEFIKARGLLDWMCGDKKVAATAKKEADIKGDLTKNDVYTFLRGMLELFRKAGHPGLLLVLDEVETIRHYNKNLRGKALEVLRDIVDKVLSNNLPGLLLMVTGTPALYESEEGIPALEPLNQRVKVTFGDDPSTDNLRQTQIRLHPLDSEGLNLVAHKIREIYPADHPERLQQKVDDDFIDHLLNSSCVRSWTSWTGWISTTISIPTLTTRSATPVFSRSNSVAKSSPSWRLWLVS
jgi:hypothetical protein